jgi:hypothetical protein
MATVDSFPFFKARGGTLRAAKIGRYERLHWADWLNSLHIIIPSILHFWWYNPPENLEANGLMLAVNFSVVSQTRIFGGRYSKYS